MSKQRCFYDDDLAVVGRALAFEVARRRDELIKSVEDGAGVSHIDSKAKALAHADGLWTDVDKALTPDDES